MRPTKLGAAPSQRRIPCEAHGMQPVAPDRKPVNVYRNQAVTPSTFGVSPNGIMGIIVCLTRIMQVHAREGLRANLSATALLSSEWTTRSTVGTSNRNLVFAKIEGRSGRIRFGDSILMRIAVGS